MAESTRSKKLEKNESLSEIMDLLKQFATQLQEQKTDINAKLDTNMAQLQLEINNLNIKIDTRHKLTRN